ncbi:methylenetetrahydrofolate reductase [Aliirhizobium cellulosilyticum]|jgi:methylenetetrahydrofolate reductase (NADPH)|uniref:Methylenetetrahydrofolate reductase (NADPH) n=1 Tax=Aliirhizobium cellulosilyticum TaxID=393664 RepID=A0A7W6SDP7_9HYPH|nr:methylenetetrahydrofolate reductase [Rhizobium cellulosilyticum]MBB4351255.1 methylenetetrahydrofolate reductase (NADPH) [Rhizobium cellulosilyticum]MBB4414453.1 methylenetetrahydrofolate reductase (NADPH) [Rhizobium cellulosilyticum]MBB4449069.1 methylenetetrahydrofolate reductase (NADPH) [Rhizobium cellulosilyticum]
MAILNLFKNRRADEKAERASFGALLDGYSIEVMPRTAAKIDNFREFLPAGMRVYIAHIDGTPIEDMVATAKRLTEDGYAVMPHVPARLIRDKATLEDWISRYVNDAGVTQALLLAGGLNVPRGDLESSLQLLETGLFGRYGFKRLHIAGHPEGNRDIDKDGTTRLVDRALKFKQAYSENSDAEMAIVTQFAFDAGSITRWVERIADAGVTLPIHLGVAGPTKLQTLIKFAISCGIGPSLSVLQRRAMDLSKLLVPYEPDEFLTEIANYKATHPQSLIDEIHVFPLGGIRASADWVNERVLKGKVASQ